VNTDTDRPVCDPLPIIEKALVLESPFDDIVRRQLITNKPPPHSSTIEEKKEPYKKSFKAIKNRNLISFADEDEDGEDAGIP